MECKRIFLGKEIRAVVWVLDLGIVVMIAGGDLSHVGSVSVVNGQGELQTISFPNHKDWYIGDVWAKKIFEVAHVPVSVSAGIHYDSISAEEIRQVQEIAQDMLEEICLEL